MISASPGKKGQHYERQWTDEGGVPALPDHRHAPAGSAVLDDGQEVVPAC